MQALGQNLFFNKVAGQVFSCKFCEISKNSFFYRTPLDGCFCICSTEWRIQYYDPEKCFCKFYSRKTRKHLPLTLLSGFSSSTKSKAFIPPKFLTVKFRSSQPLEVFCKKRCSRNFAKFKRKRLSKSPFYNKVADLRPQACNFIKKETFAQAFYCIE